MLFLAFLLQITVMAAAVLVAGPSVWRRAISALLVAFALVYACVAPVGPFPRGVLAVLGWLLVVKVVQLASAAEYWSPWRRLWHALVPFDLVRTQRVAPAVSLSLMLSTLAYGAMTLLVLFGLQHLPPLPRAAAWVARLSLGGVLVYCGMEVITGAIRFLHRLVGIAVPPIQQAPILSQSVGEFWSKRWNRSVSGWLDEFVFRPLARRRRSWLGLAGAFVVSAILHAWIFFAGLGSITDALLVGAFFLLQAPVVLLESRLHMRTWPRSLRHAWTIGLLLLFLPLFVFPALRLLEIQQ